MLDPRLPAAAATEESLDLDDALITAPAQSRRLAGAGGALGSCVGVVAAVLAVGTAGSVSEPRAGLAGELDPQPAVGFPEMTPESAAARVQPARSTDQLSRTRELERAVLEIQAEVQAAEARLALLRAEARTRALRRAESALQRADRLESDGSPFEGLDAQSLAVRTRERARERLSAELAPLDALQEQAETDLDQLRQALESAQDRLKSAQIGEIDLPSPTGEPSSPSSKPEPGSRLGVALEDLQSLIGRHRASLLAAPHAAR